MPKRPNKPHSHFFLLKMKKEKNKLVRSAETEISRFLGSLHMSSYNNNNNINIIRMRNHKYHIRKNKIKLFNKK